MFVWLADWWDSAQLWLTQLAFPLQFALVMIVLVPVSVGVAWLIDRVGGAIASHSAASHSAASHSAASHSAASRSSASRSSRQ